MPAPPGTGCDPGGPSAAAVFGWGAPNRVDEFTTALGPNWEVYDGPRHRGNGRRTTAAVSVQNGVLTITGDTMAWNPGATDVAAPGVGRDLIHSPTEGRPDAVQTPGAVPGG